MEIKIRKKILSSSIWVLWKLSTATVINLFSLVINDNPFGKLSEVLFNPRTYKWGWMPPRPPKVFLSIFLEDKSSAPDVFSSYSFIPSRAFWVKFSDGQFLWLQAIFEWKYMFFSTFINKVVFYQ